jgi:hypothetical protein
MAPTFYRDDDPDRSLLPETFIDRYTAWGQTATDAPKQYHTANAVVMLSTIMSPYIALETSYGEIKPNVWSMILAGTTITRKSTTMDMAIKMLEEVHPDFLMGTDGSPEGIMSELAQRDGRISLFHRDEITGWIDSTNKRDYLSGMLETFTRLYDGKSEKRVLRKEMVEVKDPNLVIMAGGIKNKMAEIMTMDHIRSGFLPRFIMVSGTTTADDVRPIGPPPAADAARLMERDPREAVLEELYAISTRFLPKKTEEKVEIAGVVKILTARPDKKYLTASPEVWERIQKLKYDAYVMGDNSTNPDIYIPLFDRLSNTVIKVAMLLCGAEGNTEISMENILKAIALSDRWLKTIIDFADQLERMPDIDKWEKRADKILDYMDTIDPSPLTRADMMRRFRIKSKDVEDIEKTLVARGHIFIEHVKMSTGPKAKTRVQYRINMPHRFPSEGAHVVAGSVKETPDRDAARKPFYNPTQSSKEYFREVHGTETPSQSLSRMPIGEDG